MATMTALLRFPRLLAAAGAALATGCVSPTTASVALRTEHGTVFGLSTEAGILALSDVVGQADEIEFRYHYGNGEYDDKATVTRRDETLSVLTPYSSAPNQARLAASAAGLDDDLYIEAPHVHADPELIPVTLLGDGTLGDLIRVKDGRRLEDLARIYAGAGVFADREGFLQLVGILNGVFVAEAQALGFIGVGQIARVLSHDDPYFQRRALPRRADFEYGMPRQMEGEAVIASGVGATPEAPDPAEAQAQETIRMIEELLRQTDPQPPPDTPPDS